MTDAPFANYQYELYIAGLSGQKPARPVTYDGLEALAHQTLPPPAYGYVAGSAGSEDTARANLDAFKRWRIVPRMLRNTAERDLRTSLFGTTLPSPVLLAPVGVQSIVHPEAELATARAAASLGVPFVLSTAASNTLEDVAAAAGAGPRWYQLYWPRDDELAWSLVARAEAAGYTAIVVTLDTHILAWRPRDLAEAYLPFLEGQGVANYFSDPVFRSRLSEPPEDNPQGAILYWASQFGNPTLEWSSLAGLRERTKLPILLKGICHPDDARLALDAGVDGIVVSNHGGRQVDGALAALDALPGVVEAVAGRVPVLFDSGIRGGSDIVKARALGAQAVLLGRPFVWGLACGGEEGVRDVLRAILAELDLTLALSGLRSIDAVDRDLLVRT